MVIILAWIFSVAFLVALAFTRPWIFSSPVPYPWMAIGLFVSPAILGAYKWSVSWPFYLNQQPKVPTKSGGITDGHLLSSKIIKIKN
ncbi:hypothetical protein YC2023_031292 [Brassica napus]